MKSFSATTLLLAVMAALALGFGAGFLSRPAVQALASSGEAPSVRPAATQPRAGAATRPATAAPEDPAAAGKAQVLLQDLSGVDVTGLEPGQLQAANDAANRITCTCGCSLGSIATCKRDDPKCSQSTAMVKQVVDLARKGRDAGQIAAAVSSKARSRPGRPVPGVVYEVPVSPDDPWTGSEHPKVTIVEFDDFQCPFCAKAEPTMKKVLDTYGSDVRLVFKHHPLPFHSKARPAHRAAEALARQGRELFWAFFELAHENHAQLGDEAIRGWVEQVGGDLDRLDADLADPAIDARIDQGVALAGKLGATGTPAFFINGQFLRGAKPFESFKQVIDQELAKADAMLARGVPLAKLYDEIMKDAREAP